VRIGIGDRTFQCEGARHRIIAYLGALDLHYTCRLWTRGDIHLDYLMWNCMRIGGPSREKPHQDSHHSQDTESAGDPVVTPCYELCFQPTDDPE
jgi:hypothetical protein